MDWAINDAQRKFSELLYAATEEPQLIYQQEQLIAAVVDSALLQEFLAWQQSRSPSLADAFAALRKLCVAEDHTLEVPARNDRSNSFTDLLNDASV